MMEVDNVNARGLNNFIFRLKSRENLNEKMIFTDFGNSYLIPNWLDLINEIIHPS